MDDVLFQGLCKPQADLIQGKTQLEKNKILSFLRDTGMNTIEKRRRIAWKLEIELLKYLQANGVTELNKLKNILMEKCKCNKAFDNTVIEWLKWKGFHKVDVQEATISMLKGVVPPYRKGQACTQVREIYTGLMFFYVVLSKASYQTEDYILFCERQCELHLKSYDEMENSCRKFLQKASLLKDKPLLQIKEILTKEYPFIESFFKLYEKTHEEIEVNMGQDTSTNVADKMDVVEPTQEIQETQEKAISEGILGIMSLTAKPTSSATNHKKRRGRKEEAPNPTQKELTETKEVIVEISKKEIEVVPVKSNEDTSNLQILSHIREIATILEYEILPLGNIEKLKVSLIKTLATSGNDYVLSALREVITNSDRFNKEEIVMLLEVLFVALSYEGIDINTNQRSGEIVEVEASDAIKKYLVTQPVINDGTISAVIKYPEWLHKGEVIVPMVITPDKKGE